MIFILIIMTVPSGLMINCSLYVLAISRSHALDLVNQYKLLSRPDLTSFNYYGRLIISLLLFTVIVSFHTWVFTVIHYLIYGSESVV